MKFQQSWEERSVRGGHFLPRRTELSSMPIHTVWNHLKHLCPRIYSGCFCVATCRLGASNIHLSNDQRWHISASGESQVQGKNSLGLGANVWPRFQQSAARTSWKNCKSKTLILSVGHFIFLYLSLWSHRRMDASSSLSSSRPCLWLLGGL